MACSSASSSEISSTDKIKRKSPKHLVVWGFFRNFATESLRNSPSANLKTLKIMEDRMKRYAALYMLIKLVDDNNGNINIGTNKVKRVFNDENDVVKIEYTTGEVGLLADADYKTMDAAIRKWQKDNQ